MAKKKPKRGGRTTPPGTRPRQIRRRSDVDDGPDLVDDVRQALQSGEPLQVLALASMMIEVSTERPLQRYLHRPVDSPDLGMLITSFVESGFPEMAAFATVMLPMIERGELAGLAHELAAELALEKPFEPAWLNDLEGLAITGAQLMSDVLGDGDNIIVGAVLPSGHPFTAVLFVDHNMSSLAKDAFMVPAPIDDVVAHFRRLPGSCRSGDITFKRLDPADARARIEDAIKTFEIMLPPVETNTWPMCRPLVEWIVSKLPRDARPPDPPEFSEEYGDAIVAAFLTSRFAQEMAAETGLSRDDARSLTSPLIWFASGHGVGDALRWSPQSVEIVLLDWYPRKVMMPEDILRRLPDVLVALVRYAHDQRDIRPGLTASTLKVIQECTPDYLRSVSSTSSSHHHSPFDFLDDDNDEDYRDDDSLRS